MVHHIHKPSRTITAAVASLVAAFLLLPFGALSVTGPPTKAFADTTCTAPTITINVDQGIDGNGQAGVNGPVGSGTGSGTGNGNRVGSNDGSSIAGLPQNTVNLAGLDFQVVQVTPLSGQMASDINPADSSTYTVVGTNPLATAVTNDGGIATLDLSGASTSPAYFVVSQTNQNANTTPMSPFLVAVPLNNNCSVNVYPKVNYTDSAGTAIQYVTAGKNNAIPDKGTPQQASTASSQAVTWNLVTAIPNNQVSWPTGTSLADAISAGTVTGGTYVITDTLSTCTTLDTSATGDSTGVSFDVAVEDNTTNLISNQTAVALTEGTDYTTALSGQTLTITLTAPGQAKVLAAKQSTVASDTQKVVLETNVSTKLSTDASCQTGEIGNGFTASITDTLNNSNATVATQIGDPSLAGTAGTQISLPGTTASSTNSAVVYLGGIDLLKVDVSPTSSTLAGATFYLTANLTGTQFYGTDGKIYSGTVNSDGSVTASGLPSGVSLVTASEAANTTGSNGQLHFTGLALPDATSVSGAVTTANSSTSTNPAYYALETKAPTGYTKPSSAFPVVAKVNPTMGDGTFAQADNPITNSTATDLPFTGGHGLALLIVAAGLILLVAFLILTSGRSAKNKDKASGRNASAGR